MKRYFRCVDLDFIGRTVLCAGIALLAALGGSPAGARAANTDWTFVPADSEIEFTGTSLRADFTGHFDSFEADIDFDPQEPEAGHIKVEIDTRSITTGLKEIDSLLVGPDWFASRKFPSVVFEASGFRRIEGDRYAVDGTVTVKGKTGKVELEAEVALSDDRKDPDMIKATAVSQIPVKRLVYMIGVGPWADTQLIADDVMLNVKLAARRAKPDDDAGGSAAEGEAAPEPYFGLFSNETEKDSEKESDGEAGKEADGDTGYWDKHEADEDAEDGKGDWERSSRKEEVPGTGQGARALSPLFGALFGNRKKQPESE